MTVCSLPAPASAQRFLVPEWPRGLRFVVALAAGATTGLAFEPTNLWLVMFIGIAAWLLLFDPRLRPKGSGFGVGYGFGLGLGAVSLNWLSVLVEGAGPFLAAALIVFEAVFFGLLGVVVRRVRPLVWWPLAVALAWGAIEFVYGRVPFGGFGWIRLAYAQVDSPLAGLFPIIGVTGVSVLTALIAAGLAWLATRLWSSPRTWTGPVTASVALLIGLAGITTVGRAYAPEPAAGHGTVTIGMVQGNVDGGAGTGAMGRARSVTNNHLGETINLMAKARAGAVPMPDFILWPENSTDIDPELDAQTRATVTAAVEVSERPILVGAVTAGPGDDERQTSALWWNPAGATTPATGPVSDRYHKRNLVPFGEYIPYRDALLPRIPLLKLVGAQSVPGTTPGVLEGKLADGRILKVGDVICFELAYDATVHEAVRGSEILVVQSNNATYRGTPQIPQQFAITRVRAMEARREIVVSTTNALSGYVDRDGRVIDRTVEGTAASRSYVVPLRTALTPAVQFAGVYDLITVLGALVALGFGVFKGGRAARGMRNGLSDGPEWTVGSPMEQAPVVDSRKK